MPESQSPDSRGIVLTWAGLRTALLILVAIGAIAVLTLLWISERNELKETRAQLASAKEEVVQVQEDAESAAAVASEVHQSEVDLLRRERGDLQRRIRRINRCTDEILDAYNSHLESFFTIGIAMEDALFSQACGGTRGIPG